MKTLILHAAMMSSFCSNVYYFSLMHLQRAQTNQLRVIIKQVYKYCAKYKDHILHTNSAIVVTGDLNFTEAMLT